MKLMLPMGVAACCVALGATPTNAAPPPPPSESEYTVEFDGASYDHCNTTVCWLITSPASHAISHGGLFIGEGCGGHAVSATLDDEAITFDISPSDKSCSGFDASTYWKFPESWDGAETRRLCVVFDQHFDIGTGTTFLIKPGGGTDACIVRGEGVEGDPLIEGPICTDNDVPCQGECGSTGTLACNGEETVCTGLVEERDCAGECGGDAVEDCAGVCGGDAVVDCAGQCGGDAVVDCAGQCGGDAVVDCAGQCDGDAVADCAGVCNGDATLDCAGTCNGDAALDCAGQCGGDATTDCAGDCGGDAQLDCAGECNGGATYDCAGTCGGSATTDCAGHCGGGAVVDCAGVCGGDAVADCAGVCGGSAVKDCAGVCGGNATKDCAGVCGGGAVVDCHGECGGGALPDACGVCGGAAGSLEDCAECVDGVDLSGASAFNLFACGSYHMANADAWGAIAVRGELGLQGFAVKTADPGGDAIVVGGAATLTDGQVYGDIRYGASLDLVRTTLMAGGKANKESLEVFFEQRCNAFAAANLQLSGFAANAPPGVAVYGAEAQVTLTGTQAKTNAFDVLASDINRASDISINAPAGSKVVINIVADAPSVTFSDFQTTLTGVSRGGVLWNVQDALPVVIDGHSFQGSLLTTGDVSFLEGNFEGTMIAGNVSGDGEFHSFPPGGGIPCPEAAPKPTCKATGTFSLTQSSTWPGGGNFGVTVSIANSGDRAIVGWQIAVTFNGNVALGNVWNAGSYGLQGSTLTMSNAGYNGGIAVGGAVPSWNQPGFFANSPYVGPTPAVTVTPVCQ